MNFINDKKEEWQEELKFLKSRVENVSNETKMAIQKRIEELESRLEQISG